MYPIDGSERREAFVSDDPDVHSDYPEWSPDGPRRRSRVHRASQTCAAIVVSVP